MKTLQALAVAAVLLLLTGTSFEPDDRDMTAYTPVLMKKSDLPTSVFMQPPQDFRFPGKIYIYSNNIYIVDLFRGIHIIDNHNPANPHKTGFLHIPGVMDLAIRNQVLYADNAIDLVSIDVSNYPEISILDRLPDIFPEPTPPDLDFIPWAYSRDKRPADTVIVAWRK